MVEGCTPSAGPTTHPVTVRDPSGTCTRAPLGGALTRPITLYVSTPRPGTGGDRDDDVQS